MGFGGFCGGGYGPGYGRCNEESNHKREKEVSTPGNANLLNFLRTLSPGTCVVLQYDCQPPAIGTFQGFQNNTVILSGFDCFPGLVHIAANKINAVSISSPECRPRRCHKHLESCRDEEY